MKGFCFTVCLLGAYVFVSLMTHFEEQILTAQFFDYCLILRRRCNVNRRVATVYARICYKSREIRKYDTATNLVS